MARTTIDHVKAAEDYIINTCYRILALEEAAGRSNSDQLREEIQNAREDLRNHAKHLASVA